MKERLTGAIILVVFMVLLVPELLTGPVRSTAPVRATATSPEEPPLRSYTIDLADDSSSRGAAATSTSQPGTSAQPPTAEATAANPPSISETASVQAGANPEENSGATQATSPEGALGRTSSEPNPHIADKLTEAGPDAGADIRPESRNVTAGPKPAAAEKPTAGRGQRANVAPAQRSAAPEKPQGVAAAATSNTVHGGSAAAASASGWVVQLGVFASRPNAERLAQELKEKGFRVSVSESPGGGRKLFRVRTGAVVDRTAAQDLAAKLRAAGAAGSVIPHG